MLARRIEDGEGGKVKASDAERIAFEAWHLSRNETGGVLNGPYEDSYLNAMWAAWQARATLGNSLSRGPDVDIGSGETAH
jgi:hypothetical protein